MEPIYYPLENPICGEPITWPKIELGQPISIEEPKEKAKGSRSLLDLMALLSLMNKNNGPQNPIPYAQPYN